MCNSRDISKVLGFSSNNNLLFFSFQRPLKVGPVSTTTTATACAVADLEQAVIKSYKKI
jgi:hypothetical protein